MTLTSRSQNPTYLPAGYNGEIHGSLDSWCPRGFERLALITNDGTKLFDIGSINCYFGTNESVTDIDVWKRRVVAVPQLPVKLLDALITAINDFMNGSKAHRGLVLIFEVKRYRYTTPLLKHCQFN